MENCNVRLASAARLLIDRERMSQRELARHIGVDQTTVCRMLKGYGMNFPAAERLLLLAGGQILWPAAETPAANEALHGE